jgi:hypothetical protein
MLAKKIALLLAALAVSAPALADHRGHRNYRDHHVHYRPVVHHYHYRPVYRPAPRPVYVVHRPAPVYHYSHPHTGAAILVGAVLGAAIVHHAIVGY